LGADARDAKPLIQIRQQVGVVLSDEIALKRHARTVSRWCLTGDGTGAEGGGVGWLSE
jgi:hypothetical protein